MCLKESRMFSERMILEHKAPVAPAIKSGMKAETLTSTRRTSNAKRTPAIGASKAVAIPEAAPHANNKVRLRKPTGKNDANVDPIADPACTIGDSRPAEPPNPTVNALVIGCVKTSLRGRKDDFFAMASKTCDVPLSRSPFKINFTNKIVSNIPIAGVIR